MADTPPKSVDRWAKYEERIRTANTICAKGKVFRVVGTVVESVGPVASVGDLCQIRSRRNGSSSLAEVVGFHDRRVLLMPLGELNGIAPGAEVINSRSAITVNAGKALLGRVLNGLGRPVDGLGPIHAEDRLPIFNQPPRPLERRRIQEILATGIRAIDGLLTCGKGQRMGIFAGSGVGKSVLLGMIARNTSADVNVIALVGERGREVREFIERDLGEEGLRRSVVVAVTSDEAPLLRVKGAFVATTIAEYFRDQGYDVLLMMDSLTRVAMAQREIGLAIGEPPTSKGYTPSTFSLLPRLLERAGNSSRGSITGLYTVLVEGDDLSDPVADTARAILDGHIVLNRRLANQNHYPAVDPLQSVSRVMSDVVDPNHLEAARIITSLLATYREAEDLINIGAYARGSNPEIDRAIEMMPLINDFLRQSVADRGEFQETLKRLLDLAARAKSR
ncbi:MAG: flagellar protein export ATPase FliI [candidate division KSB1 bacterium]|nr:flagellar protein export ATPase FliI [candidate division KSB1 bacterium]